MRRIPLFVLVAMLAAMVGMPPASAHAWPVVAGSAVTSSSTGPAAVISRPTTAGKGTYLLSATATNLAAAGYTQTEYFASGTAQSYVAVGALGNDGHWTVKPKSRASYRTRIVVRVPNNPKKFNGTAVVEWLNVTAGIDSAPDFTYMADELLRSGYAWVGVSAQQIGVSGGAAALPIPGVPKGGLRGVDPARYGSLHHPGDAYSFDMFSQIGRAIRAPGAVKPLGVLRPLRVLAVGESQSAFALTTYINAIQPSARVYDGFFVHSRGGGAFPLAGGNITAGFVGAVKIRSNINVPVFLFETETDEALLGYFRARQPDSIHVRLWDVAGAAHADAFAVGALASSLGCGAINEAPTHYVVAAALHQLDQWVRSGTPPPSAPRMTVKLVNGSPVVQRDALGVALGGVRTAAINVPVAAYSGVATNTSSVTCLLFGSTHPFDAATLAQLYPTEPAYLTAFTQATDTAIAAGYIRPADRKAILDEAATVTF